jgi:hypothetical protein
MDITKDIQPMTTFRNHSAEMMKYLRADATPTAPAPTVATSLLALAPAVTQAVALADPQAAPTVSALATMGSAIQGLLGAVQGLASAHAAVVASVPTATPAVAPAPVPAAPVASITIAEKPAPV